MPATTWATCSGSSSHGRVPCSRAAVRRRVAPSACVASPSSRRWPTPDCSSSRSARSSSRVWTGCAIPLGFMRGREHDLNIRGAWLLMLGDAGASAGVVVAGLLTRATGLLLIDPVVSLLLAVAILWSTWGLAKDSVNLALDAVPAGIDPLEVDAALRSLEGVVEVHDLHIWGMSTTDVALTAHLIRPCHGGEDALLASATRLLRDRFGIAHATLQVEQGLAIHPCQQAAPGSV